MAFPRRSKGGEGGTRWSRSAMSDLLEVGALRAIKTGSRNGVVNVARSSSIQLPTVGCFHEKMNVPVRACSLCGKNDLQSPQAQANDERREEGTP